MPHVPQYILTPMATLNYKHIGFCVMQWLGTKKDLNNHPVAGTIIKLSFWNIPTSSPMALT